MTSAAAGASPRTANRRTTTNMTRPYSLCGSGRGSRNRRSSASPSSSLFHRTLANAMVTTMFAFFIFFSVTLSSTDFSARAEIIELDLLLDASSEEVHYIKGYLQAPGTIDLSALTLTTTFQELPDFGDFTGVDDDVFQGEDDTFDVEGDDDFSGGTSNNNELPPPIMQPGHSGSTEMTQAPASEEDEQQTVSPTTAAGTSDGGGGDSDNLNSNGSTGDGGDVDGGGGGDFAEEVVQTAAPTSTSTSASTSSPTEAAPATTSSEEGSGSVGGEDEDGSTNPSTNSTASGEGGDRRRTKVMSTLKTKFIPTSMTRRRRRATDQQPDTSKSKQTIDVVLFMESENCRTDPWGGCDWSTLGVGVPDDEMEGGISYCCSQDTSDRGLCPQDNIGTLIVDQLLLTKARGEHRNLDVPSDPGSQFVFSDDDATFNIAHSGNYIMIMANCDDFGMDVVATGDMVWVSAGGYLPGDMFGLMFFYAALALVYVIVALWYYCGMRMFQDAAIPIQKFILAAIILGLFETSFRGFDMYYWNAYGKRSDALMYAALTLGVLKRGISRCLAVMVAMGWGVIRDSLGRALFQIILLGLIYSGLTLARDYLVVAAVEVERVNLTEEEELMDLALVLTPLVIFVNVIFYFWIITSLNATTEYLKNMNQSSKLRRHLRLRCLILASLIVVGIWLLFNIAQAFTGALSQDQVWILEAAMHVNYLFILVGVAILWRPNSNAKDYAMQMELSPDGDDSNELELSSNIPSAISDDDMDSYDTDGDDVGVRHGVST